MYNQGILYLCDGLLTSFKISNYLPKTVVEFTAKHQEAEMTSTLDKLYHKC